MITWSWSSLSSSTSWSWSWSDYLHPSDIRALWHLHLLCRAQQSQPECWGGLPWWSMIMILEKLMIMIMEKMMIMIIEKLMIMIRAIVNTKIITTRVPELTMIMNIMAEILNGDDDGNHLPRWQWLDDGNDNDGNYDEFLGNSVAPSNCESRPKLSTRTKGGHAWACLYRKGMNDD